MGCGVVLNYLEVAEHDRICEYHTVKCTAFKDCKTKKPNKNDTVKNKDNVKANSLKLAIQPNKNMKYPDSTKNKDHLRKSLDDIQDNNSTRPRKNLDLIEKIQN